MCVYECVRVCVCARELVLQRRWPHLVQYCQQYHVGSPVYFHDHSSLRHKCNVKQKTSFINFNAIVHFLCSRYAQSQTTPPKPIYTQLCGAAPNNRTQSIGVAEWGNLTCNGVGDGWNSVPSILRQVDPIHSRMDGPLESSGRTLLVTRSIVHTLPARNSGTVPCPKPQKVGCSLQDVG